MEQARRIHWEPVRESRPIPTDAFLGRHVNRSSDGTVTICPTRHTSDRCSTAPQKSVVIHLPPKSQFRGSGACLTKVTQHVPPICTRGCLVSIEHDVTRLPKRHFLTVRVYALGEPHEPKLRRAHCAWLSRRCHTVASDSVMRLRTGGVVEKP